MNVEKVFKSKRKNEIKQLYEAAFPKTERMPFPLMLIMSCLWHTEFLAYYDEDVLCGIAYMASLRKQTLNRGYSGKGKTNKQKSSIHAGLWRDGSPKAEHQ